MAMIASDRISAFDHILPAAIPYKGQVLNTMAARFLEQTKRIVPNWLDSSPHPQLSIGRRCRPFPVEMVIRGYLAGHAWREYKAGKRSLCGVPMPEGMKQNEAFPKPIITPTTKAHEGHDEDISREEILKKGLVGESVYVQLEEYTRKLYAYGQDEAFKKGLILVDTKYEFGSFGEEVYLIDEVHTPDSSRYFYKDGYEERLQRGEPQKQLSKEFVREWLMEHGFQGKEGQQMPEMPGAFVNQVSERYVELFETITGERFQRSPSDHLAEDIKHAIRQALA